MVQMLPLQMLKRGCDLYLADGCPCNFRAVLLRHGYQLVHLCVVNCLQQSSQTSRTALACRCILQQVADINPRLGKAFR